MTEFVAFTGPGSVRDVIVVRAWREGPAPGAAPDQPVMLASPVSRWPVNRCDQASSQSAVTVTSYQPPLTPSGLTAHASLLCAATFTVCGPPEM